MDLGPPAHLYRKVTASMSLVEFLLYIVMTMKYTILGGTELCISPAQPFVTFVGIVLHFDQINIKRALRHSKKVF